MAEYFVDIIRKDPQGWLQLKPEEKKYIASEWSKYAASKRRLSPEHIPRLYNEALSQMEEYERSLTKSVAQPPPREGLISQAVGKVLETPKYGLRLLEAPSQLVLQFAKGEAEEPLPAWQRAIGVPWGRAIGRTVEYVLGRRPPVEAPPVLGSTELGRVLFDPLLYYAFGARAGSKFIPKPPPSVPAEALSPSIAEFLKEVLPPPLTKEQRVLYNRILPKLRTEYTLEEAKRIAESIVRDKPSFAERIAAEKGLSKKTLANIEMFRSKGMAIKPPPEPLAEAQATVSEPLKAKKVKTVKGRKRKAEPQVVEPTEAAKVFRPDEFSSLIEEVGKL